MTTIKVGDTVKHQYHGVKRASDIAQVIEYDHYDQTYRIQFEDGTTHWCFDCLLTVIDPPDVDDSDGRGDSEWFGVMGD